MEDFKHLVFQVGQHRVIEARLQSAEEEWGRLVAAVMSTVGG